MFWDRRRQDRRGPAFDPGRDPDRRQLGRDERRRWTCGILFRTSLPASEVEAWLARHAMGQWQVGLEGVEEDLGAKVLKLMFERQEDKVRFMAAFAGRR